LGITPHLSEALRYPLDGRQLFRETDVATTPNREPSAKPEQTGSEGVSAEEELEQLRDAVLDDWLLVTSAVTDALRDMQQTLSWRVTRPLRRFRTLQRKVEAVGIVPAGQLAAAELARRIGR
jgi:hypothetical protein